LLHTSIEYAPPGAQAKRLLLFPGLGGPRLASGFRRGGSIRGGIVGDRLPGLIDLPAQFAAVQNATCHKSLLSAIRVTVIRHP
jgi:hypothetical protein